MNEKENKLIEKLDGVYSIVLSHGETKEVMEILSLIDKIQNKIEEL